MGMEVVQLKDQLGMVVDQDLYGKKVQLSWTSSLVKEEEVVFCQSSRRICEYIGQFVGETCSSI